MHIPCSCQNPAPHVILHFCTTYTCQYLVRSDSTVASFSYGCYRAHTTILRNRACTACSFLQSRPSTARLSPYAYYFELSGLTIGCFNCKYPSIAVYGPRSNLGRLSNLPNPSDLYSGSVFPSSVKGCSHAQLPVCSDGMPTALFGIVGSRAGLSNR